MIGWIANHMNDLEIDVLEEYDRECTAGRWKIYNTYRGDWPVELLFEWISLQY